MRTSVILEVVEKIQEVYKCANNIEQENIIQPKILIANLTGSEGEPLRFFNIFVVTKFNAMQVRNQSIFI